MIDTGWRDATELAELVANGEVTPAELLEETKQRIARVNDDIAAVNRPMFEEAAATLAALPEGPFKGVPYLLKDLTAAYAGVPMTCGSKWLEGYVPKYDSELVKRLKRAGLVIAGKTNTPEFGLPPTTEPRAWKRSRNPWNTEHHTGGSSGGSAAAVAAGIVPMAHANDGGGSIRIPASCCGLFGLKPTRARNPLGPSMGDAMNGLVMEHAVTRSVRDSARLLDATSGPDVGDPYWAPPPSRPFIEEVGVDPGKLRIAFTLTPFNGTTLHADCVEATKQAAGLLEELGHHVEEAAPAIDGQALSRTFLTVYAAGTSATLAAWTEVLGRAPKDGEIEPLTKAFAAMGDSASAADYLRAVTRLQQFSRTIAHFMGDYDVWLTPTLGEPPLAIGELDPKPDNPMWSMMRAASYVPFTPICNMTGQPAMSVPLHHNEAGLPIGTHFMGRFGDEATLFRLASQLERAKPWHDRHPSVNAVG